MSEVGQKRERSVLEEIHEELAQELAKKQRKPPEFPFLKVDQEEIIKFIKKAMKHFIRAYNKTEVSCKFSFSKGKIWAMIDTPDARDSTVYSVLCFVDEWKKTHPDLYAMESGHRARFRTDYFHKMEMKTWNALEEDPRFRDCEMWFDKNILRYVITW